MRRRGAGFTLVEVLVALLIMAVIAGMGWQGVSAMARAREIASAASERALRLSALVGQWEQDLAAVYDSPQVPGLSFDGAALRIVRRVDDGVVVVVWSLREAVWRRWASAVATRQADLQQAWLASQQLQGNQAGQLHLLDSVRDWQVYFWRGQGWSNAQSSADVQLVAVSAAVSASSASSAAGAAGGASAAGSAGSAGAAQAGAAVTQRLLLPTGVRLVIELPEGRIQRDVMLSPQLP